MDICSEAFRGKILQIVSPAIEGYTPCGIPHGSATGNVMKSVSKVVRDKYALPPEVSEIKNYGARYYTILRIAIEEDITVAATANPSSFLSLAERLKQWQTQLFKNLEEGSVDENLKARDFDYDALNFKPNPKLLRKIKERMKKSGDTELKPVHIWPNLKMLACWTGGNCTNYLKGIKDLYGDVGIKDPGYLASELRGSIPLRLNDPSGVLSINDNFYEFVDVDDIESPEPKFLTVDQVKKDRSYYSSLQISLVFIATI